MKQQSRQTFRTSDGMVHAVAERQPILGNVWSVCGKAMVLPDRVRGSCETSLSLVCASCFLLPDLSVNTNTLWLRPTATPYVMRNVGAVGD
jgi:hypothetical protein